MRFAQGARRPKFTVRFLDCDRNDKGESRPLSTFCYFDYPSFLSFRPSKAESRARGEISERKRRTKGHQPKFTVRFLDCARNDKGNKSTVSTLTKMTGLNKSACIFELYPKLGQNTTYFSNICSPLFYCARTGANRHSTRFYRRSTDKTAHSTGGRVRGLQARNGR